MAFVTRPVRALGAALTAVATLGLALFAGSALAVPAAIPAATCSTSPYAYAGLLSNTSASGIQAVVTSLAAPDVPYGHVAGWIGVGGANVGPNGATEWLQTGLASMAGGASELYAEITRAGVAPQYVTLVPDVAPGTSFRIGVVQTQRNVWQVTLGGKPATDAIYLPGSSRFAPMAMSESWNGGQPDCNGFEYRFDQLRIASASGAWKPLTKTSTIADVGYGIVNRTQSGFTAMSA